MQWDQQDLFREWFQAVGARPNISPPRLLTRNTNIPCLGQTALMVESAMLDILIKCGGILISWGWPIYIFLYFSGELSLLNV